MLLYPPKLRTVASGKWQVSNSLALGPLGGIDISGSGLRLLFLLDIFPNLGGLISPPI